jgi:hypothetical protein
LRQDRRDLGARLNSPADALRLRRACRRKLALRLLPAGNNHLREECGHLHDEYSGIYSVCLGRRERKIILPMSDAQFGRDFRRSGP